jgi:hypothetical protein
MANKVTFDFSVASKFVSDTELDMMKSLTATAKDQLLNKTAQEMTFGLDRPSCRLR